MAAVVVSPGAFGRLAITLLCAASMCANADTVYRCKDASGKLTFTDKPCAGGAPYKTPQRVEVPPPPTPDVSGLPKDANGRPVLIQTPQGAITLEKQDKRTPLNVLAACSVLITRCVKPGERDLDACFMSAPRCASARPWEDSNYKPCCPQACWQRYEARRKAGATPIAALDLTLYGGDGAAPPCIPLH